jgi:hypothetical protein
MDGSLISEAQADALSGGGLIQMASGCSVGGFCQPGSSSYVDHSVFPANNILCSYVYGTSHFVTAFGDPFIITDTPEPYIDPTPTLTPRPTQPPSPTPTPTPSPTPAKPDLIPEPITVTGECEVGFPITFDSGVTNAGDSDSGDFTVKWFVNRQDLGYYGLHEGVRAHTTVSDGNSRMDYTPEKTWRHFACLVCV